MLNIILRRFVRILILCLLVGPALTVVFPSLGKAQSIGGEGGGLGTLLQQLQTLQSRGALESATGSTSGALDAARGRASGGIAGDRRQKSRLAQIREQDLLRQIKAEKLAVSTFYCRSGAVPSGTSEAELNLLVSAIERDFCRRVGEPLQQYGYDLLTGRVGTDNIFNGAIQDDYVLGIGDEIVISYHGQTDGSSTVRIDREGRINIEKFPPFSVAGLTFREFRRELESRVKSSMIGTEVFVSLGSVRAVNVTVAGEVELPGHLSLTNQATIIDALAAAGGVRKSGSLRKIQIFRRDEIYWIDLYELILGIGLSHRLPLLDGDRIVVPPIGATVAAVGRVKRPAIFELSEGRQSAILTEVLELAGGSLRPKGNIYSLIAFDASGRETIQDYADTSVQVADGGILRVRLNQNIQLNTVELLGHVRLPGRRSLTSAPTLRALLGGPETLKDNPYLLFAVLETTDPTTRSRRLFPVNLQSILGGIQDFTLRDQDRLIVLGSSDIRYLMSNDVQQVLQFGRAIQSESSSLSVKTNAVQLDQSVKSFEDDDANVAETSTVQLGNPVQQLLTELGLSNPPQRATRRKAQNKSDDEDDNEDDPDTGRFACGGLQSLATIASTTRSGRFIQAIRATGLESTSPLVNPLSCPPVFDLFPELLPFLLEHVVAIDGEVRSPGAYPMLNRIPLSSVIAVAGGLTRNADLQNLELTRFTSEVNGGEQASVRQVIDVTQQGFDSVTINAGDVIRFNRVFTDRDSGPVLLSGEFVRPGLFDIRRGERLSEVIARAGGLTAQAYPYGAVFTRQRVKRAQQAGFERAQRELTSAATYAAAKKGVDPSAVIALQKITQDLNAVEALGRVVIEADPTVLRGRPEFDSVLEPGDRLFMPKRPNSVLVIGDVLNPGALQFVSGQRADQYIRQAGGFQLSADQDRVFVVFPNGVAQPVSVSVWNYNPAQVPPGSTIVAPKNPAPLDIFTFAKDIGSLVSQLAITAASLAVIGDNN